MNYELIIAIAVSIIIGMFLVLLLFPIKTEKFYISRSTNVDPVIAKLANTFGGDIIALFPKEKLIDKDKTSKIELLLRKSANPWKISPQEYIILRLVTRVLGGVFAGIILIIGINFNKVISAIVALMVFSLMWIYVDNYHKNVSDEREKEFLYELPEAIDYLVMALSGGYSLNTAFEMVLDMMKDSVVKTEFEIIVNEIGTEKTLSAALEGFADRAPTESVRAFSKALSNANVQAVSTIDILKARAKASRLDLSNEINKRIIQLPQKTTLILSPSIVFSIMLVVGSPALFTLLKL